MEIFTLCHFEWSEKSFLVKEYRDKDYKWVVDADIDAYFDNINHELLLSRVKELIKDENVLRLIELLVKTEIYDGKSVFRLEKGIPQGSVISPIMANLFLDSMDEMLMEKGYSSLDMLMTFSSSARKRMRH